ncbi:MAG: hypothetical protein RLZZ440_1218 [Planctomycetota bacterium]
MTVRRRMYEPPDASGGRLVEPPIVPSPGTGSIEALVDNNKLLRTALDVRIGDMRLWELVAATRREVLMVAAEYTGSYRDVFRPSDTADWITRPVIMGGHQPELFHPGVWLKNSVLDAYARRVGGTAVNLVVDSDRCGRASVGVPVGTPEAAHVEHIDFDGPAPEQAWEERGVVDPDCLASFGDRAADMLVPLVPNAIVRRWWPLVVERAAASHRLGLGIAQARHMLEERFGLETLELPVAEMVRLPTVMVFVGWLLAHARPLHEAYNAALADHRRARRIRGRGRPMPDLALLDDGGEEWIELPWWMWSKDDRRRRRVFASTAMPGGMTLSDLETVRVELPIAADTSPSKWIDALSRMEEHGVRLRPRALVTTLIARLLVADVFVHGIGGAAYDTITDGIVRRLVGSDPPRHAVVSGTLRLPLERMFPGIESADPRGELAAVMRTLRDITYHPERHLESTALSAGIRELVISKQRWIDTVPTPTLARRRCHEIRAVNQALAAHVGSKTTELEGRIPALEAAERARKVLWSRTHPWCFFPEKMLREFLLLENA